ncbi:MAG: ABC transporter ATP-binding protein [Tepidisphaeraceae bacterium]
MPDPQPHLGIYDLHTGYAKKEVLGGVTLDVLPGEVVALIGHNGAGKSTVLKAAFGMLPIWAGHVALQGSRINLPSPRIMLGHKVAYSPQGNRVFGELTVLHNLELGGLTLASKAELREGLARVLLLFPALRGRTKQRAGTLSGGERQMLSLAMALITSPRLLLLDEPSLGLAAPTTRKALDVIHALSSNQGVSVLIVEQKVREVLRIADRVFVLRNGRVSFSGKASALEDEARLRAVYL